MQKENRLPGLKSSGKHEKAESTDKECNLIKKDIVDKHRCRFIKSSKVDKFSCPVAVFSEKENPNQKVMYPKHLVYAEGKDIQLEEIRAMHYWKNIKNSDIEGNARLIHNYGVKQVRDNSTQTDIEDIELRIQKVQMKESYTQTDYEVSAKTSGKPENEYLHADGPKKIVASKEIQTQTEISTLSPGLSLCSRNFETANAKMVVKSQVDSSIKLLQAIEVVENENENFIDPKSNNRSCTFPKLDCLEDEDETTFDTKAFRVLPSSTPFRITTNEDKECEISNKNDSVFCKKSCANLSAIVELSKERFSQSITSNKHDGICSKTYSISPNVGNDLKDESNKNVINLGTVTNPFDENLIAHLLTKVSFPTADHLPGYLSFNFNSPLLRSKCSVELGSNKYNVVEKIGEGSYARILKVHVENKPSKSMALKLQNPPCHWEWYINKEIFRRLNDSRKEQFFIEYSKIYVFKDSSLILSEWAPYGNILNLINSLRNVKNATIKERCPMSVCLHLSVQLISSIQFLHTCQIIHGDVKPDNFVLVPCPNNSLKVKLIDFGRAIDMKLFPPHKVFNYVVSTENFTCNEMKENKPWTYQTDLFGLAGIMYILLMGSYMKTIKRGEEWVLVKSLPRYFHPDVWTPIFHDLLNVPSCDKLPNLSELKERLKILLELNYKNSFIKEMNGVVNILSKQLS